MKRFLLDVRDRFARGRPATPPPAAEAPVRVHFPGTSPQAAEEERLMPLIGEVAWHSVNADPAIAAESERHLQLVRQTLGRHGFAGRRLHLLEVASYAHTTGYRLAEELDARVTLFEISRHSLALGWRLADPEGRRDNPRRVAGDFHALPFEDASFDFVFICSAVHHTWRYEVVLRELMRVLAPGGLLFLENEPTLRRLCFYRFRCNRLDELEPFERALSDASILRTVAEPYIGSRPEQLFGMIENQVMPLERITGTLAEAGEIEALEIQPEQCMGELERACLAQAGKPAARVSAFLANELRRRCRQVAPLLGRREVGLGFALPGDGEIAALAEEVGPLLAALPRDEGAPEYRVQVARVFGGSVRLVVRKRAAPGVAPDLDAKAARFDRTHALAGGMYDGFPAGAQRLLAMPPLCPDIRSATDKELHAVFPASDWRVDRRGEIVSVRNQENRAAIRLALPQQVEGELLLVLRFYWAVEGERWFRCTLRSAGEPIFAYDAYRRESTLARIRVPAARLRAGALELELTPADGVPAESFTITLSHLSAFPLGGAPASALAPTA
jgi:ubiquinone/menaquinone biosynthesis C-methylase UbiE